MKNWMTGLVFALLAICYTAIADVAPPSGYVEKCTLEKQHYDDYECLLCQRDMINSEALNDGGLPEGICKEQTEYKTEGYEKKCNTWGGSVWDEIWCRPSPGAEGPASNSDNGNCSVVSVGRKMGKGTLELLLLLLQ